MIKIENTVIPSPEQWKAVIMGCRNPMNSWNKSDSDFENFKIGENDHDLMMRLRKAGTDHRKFMRMITVYADVTAPLYWWSEYDTYKVGTVANSCSKMHKLHAKEFTLEDFSYDHLIDNEPIPTRTYSSKDMMEATIKNLNIFRELFIETKDKKYWWQMIQHLPSSYNQKRTVMLNYEVLANIYRSRQNHKLDEWHEFCHWIEGLPYSEIIIGEEYSDENAELMKGNV